jgi:hypothetical protein
MRLILRRTWLTLLAIGSLSLWPAPARAEPAVCLSAPVEGQKMRKAEKLLDARERFLACAQKGCPAEVVDDCARWASEVEAALPSIVVAARDASGRDVTDARASVDGRPFAPLGERPVRLDPGTHTVLVSSADGKEIRREFSLHEGEKGREIVAVFGVPLDATGAPLVAPPLTVAPSRPVPLVVWVVGGVAAASAVTFVTAGALGLGSRASNHCDLACTPSAYDDVETKYHVADVSLGISLAALGVTAWLYFTRPPAATQAASIELRPLGAGVIGWGGSF